MFDPHRDASPLVVLQRASRRQTQSMERDRAVAIVEREAGRLLALATAPGADLAAPVPSCPGWDLEDVVIHLGRVYNWAGTIVADGLLASPGGAIPQRPETMSPTDWMADRLARLVGALRETPNDVSIWNFGLESPAGVAFWYRRQAHETAVHRMDAELAAGVAVAPLEADIAADMVSELLAISHIADVTDTAASQSVSGPGGAGVPAGSVHLHASDVDGAEWTIDVAARTVSRRHAKADAAVRGSAWALARWCWGRPTDGEIEIFGDEAAAEAWRGTVAR
jgi:uncharacterized protein (TIGR03083 family)